MTARRDVSLARVLSKSGIASRAVAGAMIREGRVRVNGRVVKDPAVRCSMTADRITLDGARIAQQGRTIVVAMHKPPGVVTTRSDERGRKTVYDVLGDAGKWLVPVGRLDRETSGLLIFTDDHRLGERLTNPSSKVPKTYLVDLDSPMKEEDAEQLRQGISAGRERYLPARVRKAGPTSVEIVIIEGKNRQVRKMCEALGYEVRSLVRTAIGGLGLGSLKPGESKTLREAEIRLLYSEG